MPPTYANSPTMAAPGGHYSHATLAQGLVFVSGQLPITPTGEKLSGAPFEQQARQVLDNVAAAISAFDCTPRDLVQVRVYLASLDHWPAFNAIYADWIGAARPSRAVVPTGPLHFGFLIEVEAVAVLPVAPERP